MFHHVWAPEGGYPACEEHFIEKRSVFLSHNCKLKQQKRGVIKSAANIYLSQHMISFHWQSRNNYQLKYSLPFEQISILFIDCRSVAINRATENVTPKCYLTIYKIVNGYNITHCRQTHGTARKSHKI